MSVEPKRGCGFRRVGGLYLVGRPGGIVCDRLPYAVGVCPTCGHGIKVTRAIRWLDGKGIFEDICERLKEEMTFSEDIRTIMEAECHKEHCRVCFSNDLGRVGIVGVGEKFYPTKEVFAAEAQKMGVSKRIGSVSKEITLGETMILLVHARGIKQQLPDENVPGVGMVEKHVWKPAIFYAFIPVRIEKIVTDQTGEEELEKLKKRGITPVVVPHDDPDHNPKGKQDGDPDDSLPFTPSGA